MFEEKEILIIDIETTGFLGQKGKIVEIGIVSLELETGKAEIVFDQVVHETGITKEEVEKSWIVANSDLTVDMIKFSKNLNLYKDEIQKIIDDHPIGATAFNRNFDFDFMEDRGFVFGTKLPCPMLLSTDVLQLPGNYGKFKWPKVEEAYDYFVGDKGWVEKHRGAADAFDEAKIVHELYMRDIFKI